MANEITLKTKLLNHYDDKVVKDNLVLGTGEIAFQTVKVPLKSGGSADAVLMKVGNNKTAFNDLDYVAATAADVYAWAKEAGLSVTVDPASKGNVVASVSWDSDNNTLKVVKTDAVTPDELKAVTDLIGTLPTTAGAKTIVEYINKKTEGIATSGALTELSNKVTAVETAISELDDTYATDTELANAIANFATKEEAKNFADGKDAAIKEAKDRADAAHALADAARTEAEVNSQIDAKITALKNENLWDAKDSAATAEANAKGYADQLIAEANLGQYTTEDEVKSVINKVIADASEGTTYDSLVELVNYIDNHGGEAAEMASAIDVLEGKVETVEGKPAYGITATQIANWENEVGAKEIANSKTTTAEVKTQIEAYGYATVGQVTTAKESAIATAAEDATTKAGNAEANAKTHATNLNTAMDTRVKTLEAIDHNAYKAADTALHTAISAEIDADVKALADGAVKDNANAIATINNNLKSAAYTESSAYATAAQGATADSALQTVKVLGQSLTKSSNELSVEQAKTALGLGSAAYTASTNYATAAQGLKSVTHGDGLVATFKDNILNIGFDSEITFVLDANINDEE